MAQSGQDFLSKLADRGEDVVGRISDMPGTQRLLEAAGSLRERVDELQKKVRGLDALERRVAALERKVDQLSRPTSGAASSRAGAAKRTTPKRTTRAKPKPPESPAP
jgi:outer membrane murein-binding lipoprotein Lpp